MKKKKALINYTNKDFNSIKNDLLEYARIHYPNTYKDFSENSFGSYVLDAVSYVGDQLSFYLDYQVNETFLETAIEYDNIKRMAKNFGYKFRRRPSAYGTATFYVLVNEIWHCFVSKLPLRIQVLETFQGNSLTRPKTRQHKFQRNLRLTQ